MKTKILSILSLLLTVTQGAWAQTLPTDGTGAYLISSVDNWNTFCEDVNGGITYSGKTVKLTQNVGPVTMMAGGDTSFSGTFDGQGYTLTASINVQNDDMGTLAAPFPAISGATIKNLHVAGNISVNRARPASIASFVNDDSEITNCKSSVSITASRGNWVDAGGFVARVNAGKALTMTGCTFAGSITYSDANGYEGGGMVGWTQTNASANLTNCVFAPTSVSFANSKSKADNNFRMLVGGDGSSTLTRCYYNDVAANNTKIITDGEGKQARSISAGTDVTSLGISGASTEYNVSGITAYAHGIKYGGVYYAGNGDEVSLALSHADAAEGYSFNEYTATAGTLSGTTLTMPDANVTINATWTAIPTYTVTVKSSTEDASNWQGKAGTGDYQALPLTGLEASTAVSVKYSGTKMVKSVKAKKKKAATTDLSTISADYEAKNGETLTGTLTNNVKISIADGATVTLKDVTITNLGKSCNWAGINCPGDATLVLEGTNEVCAGREGDYEWRNYPGIWIAPNKTLTIQGAGKLTAYSGGPYPDYPYGAGIGGGFKISCGNIVINSGTITATGGGDAAGIGAGSGTGSCGNITINGGTITATGDGGGAGIGGGYGIDCGNITISGGTVSATGGYYAAGIGGGRSNGACGTITIKSTVTSVTATKGSVAPNSIGSGGENGTAITVTIEDGANVTQN